MGMTNRVVIDTNVYSALMLGDKEVADILVRFDIVLFSPVVYGELIDGFRGWKTRKRESGYLREVLHKASYYANFGDRPVKFRGTS